MTSTADRISAKARAVRLYTQRPDLTVQQISERVGLSACTVYEAVRAVHGSSVRRGRSGKCLSDAEVDEIVRVYAECGSVEATARGLGHGKTIARKWLLQRGIELKRGYTRPAPAARCDLCTILLTPEERARGRCDECAEEYKNDDAAAVLARWGIESAGETPEEEYEEASA